MQLHEFSLTASIHPAIVVIDDETALLGIHI